MEYYRNNGSEPHLKRYYDQAGLDIMIMIKGKSYGKKIPQK